MPTTACSRRRKRATISTGHPGSRGFWDASIEACDGAETALAQVFAKRGSRKGIPAPPSTIASAAR
jgi:hypothetical protein